MLAVLPKNIDGLRLAECLSARFSHDLTGPMGAVNNGAEFLQEDDAEMRDQAVGLIASSARQAITRLQFYRMCYGQKRGTQDAASTQKIIEGFFEGSRIRVQWEGEVRVDQERLLCNLILLASETLIKGGELKVQGLRVTASAPSVKTHEELLMCLQGETSQEGLTAKNVQYFWMLMLAKTASAAIEYQRDESQFMIEARLSNG